VSRLTTADIVRINREAETQHVDDHRVVLIGGLEVTVHVAATGHLTIAVEVNQALPQPLLHPDLTGVPLAITVEEVTVYETDQDGTNPRTYL
jgi:hypothetical protein